MALEDGFFERHIPLYGQIKEAEVTANFDKGVLTITLPKTDESRSRGKRIEIQSSSGSRGASVMCGC